VSWWDLHNSKPLSGKVGRERIKILLISTDCSMSPSQLTCEHLLRFNYSYTLQKPFPAHLLRSDVGRRQNCTVRRTQTKTSRAKAHPSCTAASECSVRFEVLGTERVFPSRYALYADVGERHRICPLTRTQGQCDITRPRLFPSKSRCGLLMHAFREAATPWRLAMHAVMVFELPVRSNRKASSCLMKQYASSTRMKCTKP
jgi:hypothetical protein